MAKAPYYIRALIDSATLPRQDYTPAVRDELVRDELISVDSQGVHITDRGSAYLELLVAVPLPVKRWVDPRTTK
jgi:hypothetical protein